MADGQRQVFHPPRIPGVRMLGRYSQRSAHGGLPPHSHRGCIEICLLEKGRQAYRVEGRVYRMKGGDQFLTFPDERHDSAGGPQEKGVLYWLILDLRPRARGFLFLEPAASRALAAALRRLPTRHFRAVPGARAALDRAFAALSLPDDPLRFLEAAQALADYLLKTVAAARTGAIQQVSPRIGAALDRIAARDEEWLSVSALAEEVGLSAPRFKVRFREEAGVPPGEFMLRRKVELARARLALPERRATITEIAHALGFASSQYFATVFRRYTGISPSQEASRRMSPRRRAGTGRISPAGSSRSAS